MNKRTNDTTVCAYYARGLSLRECALLTGLSIEGVRHVLKRNGETLRPSSQGMRRIGHKAIDAFLNSGHAQEKCDDEAVMKLWRDCGLPEHFLGNGGSNHRLVAFAGRLRDRALDEAAGYAEMMAHREGTKPRLQSSLVQFAELIRNIE